jgi:hypothetical protein
MFSRLPLLTCFILAALLLSQTVNAQKHHKSKLSEDVDLPVDFALDYQLGLSERGKIRGSSALLENTAYNEAGITVFTKACTKPFCSLIGLAVSLGLHNCR